VTIVETTDYPFDERIRFTVTAAGPLDFPLYFRVPGWCDEAAIRINGELHRGGTPAGEMVRIHRRWASGDVVDVELPMTIRFARGKNRSVAVERGPLVYSLKVEPLWQKIGERFPGFPDWECRADSPWNYGLSLDLREDGSVSDSRSPESYFSVAERQIPEEGYPWDHAPIELVCKGRRIDDWQAPGPDITPDVPKSPVLTDRPEEEITLVPYGCAPVRITYFPVVRP
jgi:hypothetical protein